MNPEILVIPPAEVEAEIVRAHERETASLTVWEALSVEDQEAVVRLLGRLLVRAAFDVKRIAPYCVTGESEHFLDFRFRLLFTEVDQEISKNEARESKKWVEMLADLRKMVNDDGAFGGESAETG